MESPATLRFAKTFHLNLYGQAEKFKSQTASKFQQFFLNVSTKIEIVLGLSADPKGFKMAFFFKKFQKSPNRWGLYLQSQHFISRL